MKTPVKISLFSFLFSLLICPAFAQSGTQAFPRLEPDPRALDFHRRGAGAYSWTDLAEISLWSSDSSAPTAANLERISDMIEAIRSSPELPKDNRGKAEFVLDYMHRNLLRTYLLTQTRVDTIFSNGRFNCVSSSVLYMILCKSLGLQVSGVVTKDHAFVTVHIDDMDIDVETTNRHGFDPGRRREFHDEFGRLTGFAYVPPGNYRDRQTISEIELVSLILRNRIAELESRNRFAEAIPLAVDRTALLKGSSLLAGDTAYSTIFFEDPYQNLLDRLFNYGTALLRSSREVDALIWADLASSMYMEERRWAEFTLTAVNNRLTRLVRANQIDEARIFLETHKTILTPSEFERFDILLIDTSLANNTNNIRSVQDGESVIVAIEDARSKQKISDTRANEFLTSAIQRTASILSAAPDRDWLAGINFIEDSIARFGTSRVLEQTLLVYRNNRAADFHNRFAAAWNRRNFDEAERILNEGLAEFPDDRRLLANRETVNRQR